MCKANSIIWNSLGSSHACCNPTWLRMKTKLHSPPQDPVRSRPTRHPPTCSVSFPFRSCSSHGHYLLSPHIMALASHALQPPAFTAILLLPQLPPQDDSFSTWQTHTHPVRCEPSDHRHSSLLHIPILSRVPTASAIPSHPLRTCLCRVSRVWKLGYVSSPGAVSGTECNEMGAR